MSAVVAGGPPRTEEVSAGPAGLRRPRRPTICGEENDPAVPDSPSDGNGGEAHRENITLLLTR